MSEPLWTDSRIYDAMRKIGGGTRLYVDDAATVARQVRDEMQARIAELEAQLAAARRWEPITVETFSTEQATLAIADNEFSIITDRADGELDITSWTLPDNVRFSRRVAGEGGNE